MCGIMPNHPNRSKRNRGHAANPTPAEIVKAREDAGLTQTQAGELLHTGLRTWQNWETVGDENRRMPAAAWELFRVKVAAGDLLKAGKIKQETIDALGLHLPDEAQ